MEYEVGALDDAIEAAGVQQVCLVQGQLPGQGVAQLFQVRDLLVVLGRADGAADLVALLQQLLHHLTRDESARSPRSGPPPRTPQPDGLTQAGAYPLAPVTTATCAILSDGAVSR